MHMVAIARVHVGLACCSICLLLYSHGPSGSSTQGHSHVQIAAAAAAARARIALPSIRRHPRRSMFIPAQHTAGPDTLSGVTTLHTSSTHAAGAAVRPRTRCARWALAASTPSAVKQKTPSDQPSFRETGAPLHSSSMHTRIIYPRVFRTQRRAVEHTAQHSTAP